MSAAPPKEKSMMDKLSEGITSDGSTVRITVPAGTSPGATLHVRVPVALPPPVDPTVPVAQGTPVVTTTAEPVEPAK
jgi:hypothetical protein